MLASADTPFWHLQNPYYYVIRQVNTEKFNCGVRSSILCLIICFLNQQQFLQINLIQLSFLLYGYSLKQSRFKQNWPNCIFCDRMFTGRLNKGCSRGGETFTLQGRLGGKQSNNLKKSLKLTRLVSPLLFHACLSRKHFSETFSDTLICLERAQTSWTLWKDRIH